MSYLETTALEMRFGGVYALRNVSFSMIEGCVHCLIGPNGAGKSTFFKTLTGQLKPTAGSIKLCGDEIAGLRSFEIARRGVGVKSQVPQLFNGLSARENIWLSARLKNPGAARQRTEQIMEELKLEPVAETTVDRLSHGQRQWVEIAGVLAGEPDLILLDEPAAGMSDAEVDRTADLINRIKTRFSVLVVEHDMRFIRAIADRVTVFHRGEIFLEGTAAEVLSDEGVRDIYLGKGVLTHA